MCTPLSALCRIVIDLDRTRFGAGVIAKTAPLAIVIGCLDMIVAVRVKLAGKRKLPGRTNSDTEPASLAVFRLNSDIRCQGGILS